MSGKLLIDTSTRNLLILSEFINQNEPKIYNILNKNKKIDIQIAKENEIETEIKQNLATWINLSTKEWIPDKRNPILTTDDSLNKRCRLCNQPIKLQYKIKNKKNDHEIFIGGNCINNFAQLDSMKNIIRTTDEYKRYNKLLNYEPEISDILTKHSKFLKTTAIILPYGYYDGFDKIQKKLKKILMNYIRTGKIPTREKMDKLIEVYKYEYSNAESFVATHKNNPRYMSRSMAIELKNKQNDIYKRKLDEVMSNNGILGISDSEIKIGSYLIPIKREIQKCLPKYVKIEGANFGEFHIIVIKFNDRYKFSVDSPCMLKAYNHNQLTQFERLCLSNLQSFRIEGKDTRDKLSILAQDYVSRNDKNKLKEINIHRIISLYDEDLSSKEYHEIYEKILSILNRFTIVESKGDTNIYLYENKVLAEWGKGLLFDQSDKYINEMLQSYYKKFEIKKLYEWVIQQLA